MVRSPGDKVRDWLLIRLIRTGSNAEVWTASGPDAGEVVLKIAAAFRGERFERFKQEVTFMRSVDDPGVMPLVDSELPGVPSKAEPAWYAMPVAVPIKRALASADLPTVVRAMADFADTLARLRQSRVSHRDIKPENLFELEVSSQRIGDPLPTYTSGAPSRRFDSSALHEYVLGPQVSDAGWLNH